MDRTLSYYKENAENFINGTVAVDFSAVADRFAALLSKGASVLDYGCGSGRDTKYFLDKGFQVEAIDGSKELCRYAEEYTGIPVRCILFQDLNELEKYDGIWACSSILHVPKKELPDIFARMIAALKSEGLIYTSFKYGNFEGERNGRHFSDFTTDSFASFLVQFPELQIIDEWVSVDVRPGRSEEKWLNIILKKTTIY
ncbi:MAG: class I SAM-dependent methyltransferase [Lachnospiraceae bacterium]|nr:class I SAM-dependent methyltransferase [Lachnospiraceae bacterium]MDY4971595.1 class I SAM-dependent methyltransferase [Lachnospiraceae bacterium]